MLLAAGRSLPVLPVPVTGSPGCLSAAALTARAGSRSWEPGRAARRHPGTGRKCIRGRGYNVSAPGNTELRLWRGASHLGAGVPQDVLLFHHERATFFRLLGLFCVAQFLFWSYLAHFAFTSLKDTGYQETVLVGEQASSLPKIGGLTLNLGSDKWRYGFTTSCLTVGSLILAASYLFARRSVCRVLLCRGGQEVTVSSYLPFGSTSSFTVPLRQVSCMAHRSQVSSLIPLKISGRPFYYLLDKQGQFYNAKLFDMTVGAYRKL